MEQWCKLSSDINYNSLNRLTSRAFNIYISISNNNIQKLQSNVSKGAAQITQIHCKEIKRRKYKIVNV